MAVSKTMSRDSSIEHREKHTTPKNEIAFSAQELLELIKSLPTSTLQNQNHFSMNTNAIPEFDPSNKEQTIDIWLNKIEECRILYKWSEPQLLHYILPKLTGVARVWYQGLPSLNYTWPEWKEKLIKTFPSIQNYAQLLNEMLDRKVRVNETLETYFYHKMNLLNRCEISGKKAIDCIIYGLEDRGMRLGAQAANYSQPEDLLSYFKSVKIEDVKDRRSMMFRKQNEPPASNNSRPLSSSTIICFNCGEQGHPSFKCAKPLVSCSVCKRLGHQSSACKRLMRNDKTHNIQKPISEIKLLGNCNDKYVLPILVNGIDKTCYVDLGSQCTLMRISDFNELGINIEYAEMPILKGFGGNHIVPLGKAKLNLQVQGVDAQVEVLAVPDDLLKYSILLGHTFTEQAGIVIIKTNEHLILHKEPTCHTEIAKQRLTVEENVIIHSIAAVPIILNSNKSCDVYVHGSIRCLKDSKYYVLPGIYSVNKGKGCVMAINLGVTKVNILKGQLLTRAHEIKETNIASVNKIDIIKEPVNWTDEIIFGNDMNEDDKKRLKLLLISYKDCFSFSLADLGLTNLTEMTITLKDANPVVYRPYRLAHSEREKVKGMIQDMLNCGIITESNSSYASPIILVQKKTGDQRLCIDYRALNAKTVKEHYPLPLVEDQIDCLRGHKYYITLDLASGYYQIPIATSSQDKTAFVTPDGQYQFTRMPFGLANAPSVFQKTINRMLKDARNRDAYAFMDDIIIPADSVTEGMTKLESVFMLLRNAGLTLKLNKCKFFFTTIDYLGFEVSKDGIRPGERKTEAVEKFKVPTNQHEVRQFLGLASFFRKFVKDFAIICNPLTKLLKKDTKWEWGEKQDGSFQTLKAELIKRPILALYNPKAKTQIHTDACKTGIAGILLQEDEKIRWRAVAYYSRQTTQEEQKYHSFELETLAVIASLNRFRVYVLGIEFTIITDCNALRTTLSKRDMVPRIGRWWLQLQEYQCNIEYRPGSRMSHVDALSRNAIEATNEPEPVLEVLTVESEDWLATMQNTDDEISKIKQVLEDPNTSNIIDIHKNYKLKNGKVYRIVDSQLKWVVPRGVRWQLLKRNHDDLGHFGMDKTLDKLKSSYWFPKMRKFVKKYVQSCLDCSYHKAPSGKKEGMLHPIPKIEEPFHTVHVDHLGPFVASKMRNSFILVLIDAYTKYINLYAVKNTKTKSTIKVLNNYFSLFGVPTRLISDRGTSFTSRTFKDFINKLGIRHVLNAVATPRANGQVERYNRTILSSLAVKNHNCHEKDWDTHLEEIQLGLNTTINKTIGKSPSEVLFGIKLRTKGDGIVASLLDHDAHISSGKSLEEIRKEVSTKVIEEQEKQKDRFDRVRKEARKYKEGDLVRIERKITGNHGKSKKLLPKLQGPYRVVKILDNDRYVVEDTPLTRKRNHKFTSVVAVDKMYPWLAFAQDYLADSDHDVNDEQDNDSDRSQTINQEGNICTVSEDEVSNDNLNVI